MCILYISCTLIAGFSHENNNMLSSIFLAFFIILVSVSQTPANAIQNSYIVYMGAHSHGLNLTKDDLHKVSDSHIDFLGSYLGSKEKAKEAIFYSYRRCINGFAANIDENVANEIAKNPNVVSVFLNQLISLHTTRSWDFLSLENNNVVPPSSLWEKAKFGEDIIIGNIDTGVWPESKSFSDEGYGPIPSRWKGFCQKDADPTFFCNRKLIGAKYFKEGFEDYVGKINSSLYSPRDYQGHGSHTLSTAGGNIVPGVSIFGVGNGTVKGGAPRARVAAYKVCWKSTAGKAGCNEADILKAFDHAIYDGVDVISGSLGSGPSNYFQSAAAIGAMNAVKHDIVVVMSAGNAGPRASTVSNLAPWIITVGASTIDREFQTYVELANGLSLKGTSIGKSMIEDRLYPLVNGAQAKTNSTSAEAAALCGPETLDPEKVRGKIVVCVRGGGLSKTEKGVHAANAGAVGMILCNDKGNANSILSEPHLLPASMLTYKDCLDVFAYTNSTNAPMGTIKSTVIQVNTKPAPVMAEFSSKGPNKITPEILKPDITAPGVDIIAAYTEADAPTSEPSDTRRVSYLPMSGTSMACPHVSGVVALLKAIYPKWSPAAIRSAIMTTATTRDNSGHPMVNASYVKSNPFEYGAGQIRPDRAADPGLIYDLHMEDYLNVLCVIGYDKFTIAQFYKKPYKCPPYSDKISLINLNYPSITVPKLNGSVTVTRTVKNVGPAGTYTARVRQPGGISVTVHPNVLVFKKTSDEKSFNVTLTAPLTSGVAKDYAFGELVWSDGVHSVRSPITVATI